MKSKKFIETKKELAAPACLPPMASSSPRHRISYQAGRAASESKIQPMKTLTEQATGFFARNPITNGCWMEHDDAKCTALASAEVSELQSQPGYGMCDPWGNGLESIGNFRMHQKDGDVTHWEKEIVKNGEAVRLVIFND